MTEYIATFYSHYGAVCFKKNCEKLGIGTKIMPVPRNLSSSFSSRETSESFCSIQNRTQVPQELNEELEQIVQVDGGSYLEIYRSEE